jgi:hypothetical protein
MVKKVKGWLLAVVVFVALGFGLFKAGLVENAGLGGSGYVEAPQFGYLKCEATGSMIESSVFSSSAGSVKTIGCSNLGATDSCVLMIKSPVLKWYQTERVTLIDGQSGAMIGQWSAIDSEPDDTEAGTLLSGTYLSPRYYELKWEKYVLFRGWVIDNGVTMQWYYKYQPFVIKKFDSFSSANGQAITSIGKTSCEISYANRLDIISSSTIDEVVSGFSKEGSPVRLEPNEAYTYFTRHITVPSFSMGTDVEGAYCVPTSSGGTLYAIEQVTTNGATYNIVSPTYSEVIRNVDCCNGDSSPGKVCRGNVWVNTENAECSLIKPCPNDQFQRDVSDPAGKTAIRYSCVSGKCVAETKVVECTLNQQCGGGKICVGFKCKETCVGCNVNDTCGNSVCESWETKSSCPHDCTGGNQTCSWYESSYTKETEDYGFLGWRHLFNNPVDVKESGCKTAGWVYLVIIAFFVSVVAVVLSVYFIPKKKGHKKRGRR